MRLLTLSASFFLLGSLGCGAGLYAPCEQGFECAEGLRCVNLGADQGAMCTRACTISKKRAGQTDAADEDKYYEGGTTQNDSVQDAQCAEGEVTVTSEEPEGGGPQELGVSGDAVGVCRVSDEQLADGSTHPDSQLSGWCAPL